MICVQETVRIWFKAGISNTIKSPEAHFAAPAEDVTRLTTL